MYNKQIVIGNVGGSPKLKELDGDRKVAEFSVGCDEWRGNFSDHTEWFQVECWNKLAENVGKYVRKGMLVYVEGVTRTDSWTKDGEKKYRPKVVANKVLFLEHKMMGDGSVKRKDEVEFTPDY